MKVSYKHFRHRYGLSKEQYDSLLQNQGGVCLGCGQPPRSGGKGNANRLLFVDHDHETGDIRGLLCQGCNAAIGLVYNSPDTLRSLAKYLEREPALRASAVAGRREHGWHQKSKTHCRNGHPYSEENTYVVPSTRYRQCRICNQVNEEKRLERDKVLGFPRQRASRMSATMKRIGGIQ